MALMNALMTTMIEVKIVLTLKRVSTHNLNTCYRYFNTDFHFLSIWGSEESLEILEKSSLVSWSKYRLIIYFSSNDLRV